MTHTAPAVSDPTTADRADAVSPQPARPKGLSLRKNFGWALVGNLIYQASQWLCLVVLAKLLSVVEVGQFALALAICTPITTFSALNLRAVQVTDARNQHRFGYFLALQLIMSALSVAVIAAIGFLSGYGPQTAWVITVVGLGQAIQIVRDVFMAANQKRERMDLVAQSKIMMGVLSLLALSVGVYTTGSLLVGVIGLQGAKLIVFALWDLPVTHRLRLEFAAEGGDDLWPIWDYRAMVRLAWLALPLGISTVVVNLTTNIPRYFIEAYAGVEQLGYFAAIMALVMAGATVTQAAGQSALPRLSRYYRENRKAFARLLSKLLMLGVLLGVSGAAIAYAIGEPLLVLFFAPDYAAYHRLFFWSMLYGVLVYTVTFMAAGMMAMHRFVAQPIVSGLSLVATVLAAWWLIPGYGLIGGVAALAAGRLVYGVGAMAVIVMGNRYPGSYESRGSEALGPEPNGNAQA